MQNRERVEKIFGDLTSTERRLSTVLFLDRSFAGQKPIQLLVDSAGTSPPGILRFVTKPGFHVFLDFRRQLTDT